MNGGYEVVDAGHHGGEKAVIKTEWKTIRTTFHNFASLPAQRDEMVSSPTLECHGLKWSVELYPGGHSQSNQNETYVSFFLNCVSCKETGGEVKAEWAIRASKPGNPTGTRIIGSKTNGATIFDSQGWGKVDGICRASLLTQSNRFLLAGSLTIEVDIQVVFDKFPWVAPPVPASNAACSKCTARRVADADQVARLKEKCRNWAEICKCTKALLTENKEALKCMNLQLKPISLDMLQLLESGDKADVTFETGHNDDGKKKKTFHAHSVILSTRCPTLALLSEDYDSEMPIPIEDVDPNMFRMLLRFIYGGKLPNKEILKKDAQSIIRVADRFGCTGLKIFAEAELASAEISTDSVAELILFADATNCALLKEAAMDKFVDDIEGVMASDGYDQVKESPAILAEMMAAMVSANKKRPPSDGGDDGDDKDYKRMRVATLREKLEAKGLDIDGSKDMLVSRLKDAEMGVIEIE